MPAIANTMPPSQNTTDTSTGVSTVPARVLVVDDEPAIVDAVTYNLRQQGFTPLIAADADAALRLFREKKPDIVILDVMLPSGSGFDICRLIRQGGSKIPILMLTARVAESDRVYGLEIGADDYLIKPFGMRELMARIKALLRRGGPNAEGTGGGSGTLPGALGAPLPTVPTIMASSQLRLTIDIEKRDARVGDKPLTLSRKEFDLLSILAAHPGRVFDRQTLLDRVWGEDAYVDDRTVDVHIRWLREKIEPNPSKPQYLLTIRGIGYKFVGS